MTHQNAGPATSSQAEQNPDALQLATFTATSMALFVTALIIGYVTYISPPIHDVWYRLVEESAPILVSDVFKYVDGYFLSNPRIGQVLFHIAGGDSALSALTSCLSAAALLLFGGIAASYKGRDQGVPIEAAGAGLIILAVTIFAGREIGQSLFYIPYTTNYVASFALLLAFSISATQAKMHAPLLFAFGFVAGLTNEHTVPAFLAVGLAALVLGRLGIFDIRNFAKKAHAIAGLLSGYVALFFAPGQAKRYGSGTEASGLSSLIHDPIGRISEAFAIVPQEFWAVWSTTLALSFGITAISWYRSGKPAADDLIPIAFALISLGMIVISAASPFLVQRLMFAPYVSTGIAVAAVLLRLPLTRLIQPFVFLAACLIIAPYLLGAVSSYQSLRNAYVLQDTEIRKLAASGVRDIVVAPYWYPWWEKREFVKYEYFPNTPDDTLNPLRAKYYGVNSITFKSGN